MHRFQGVGGFFSSRSADRASCCPEHPIEGCSSHRCCPSSSSAPQARPLQPSPPPVQLHPCNPSDGSQFLFLPNEGDRHNTVYVRDVPPRGDERRKGGREDAERRRKQRGEEESLITNYLPQCACRKDATRTAFRIFIADPILLNILQRLKSFWSKPFLQLQEYFFLEVHYIVRARQERRTGGKRRRGEGR